MEDLSCAGVSLAIHGSDECDATVKGPGGSLGTVDASYDGASGVLTLSGGDLEIAAVDAECDPVLINAGDPLPVSGRFHSAPGHVITSP